MSLPQLATLDDILFQSNWKKIQSFYTLYVSDKPILLLFFALWIFRRNCEFFLGIYPLHIISVVVACRYNNHYSLFCYVPKCQMMLYFTEHKILLQLYLYCVTLQIQCHVNISWWSSGVRVRTYQEIKLKKICETTLTKTAKIFVTSFSGKNCIKVVCLTVLPTTFTVISFVTKCLVICNKDVLSVITNSVGDWCFVWYRYRNQEASNHLFLYKIDLIFVTYSN